MKLDTNHLKVLAFAKIKTNVNHDPIHAVTMVFVQIQAETGYANVMMDFRERVVKLMKIVVKETHVEVAHVLIKMGIMNATVKTVSLELHFVLILMNVNRKAKPLKLVLFRQRRVISFESMGK